MPKVTPLRSPASPSTGALLRSTRLQSGLALEQYAHALGAYMGRPGLTPGAVQAWESNQVPTPPVVLQAAMEMQATMAPAATNGPIADLIAASTAEANALAGLPSSSASSFDVLVGQAYAAANNLAVRYLTSPPGQMLAEAQRLRTYLISTLKDHVPPKPATDLYLIVALLSGISAYACLDLGNADAAMKQAQAAMLSADYAGHGGLKAWTFGTESLIARFQADYALALDLATTGLDFAGTGTSLDRLRSGQAQSLACLGDTAGTHLALHLADDAREEITTPDVAEGIFTFSDAKHAYYSGSSLIWLPSQPEARIAERESERAIALFSGGPPDERNLADEALAHIYLATSRVTLGDLDGVLDALRPVLDISPDLRISWQRKRLDRLANLLGAPPFRLSPTAKAIREEIEAFT